MQLRKIFMNFFVSSTPLVVARGIRSFVSMTILPPRQQPPPPPNYHSAANPVSQKFRPKTANQIIYRDLLQASTNTTSIVVCEGPAGTGKTAMACHYAMQQLQNGAARKIIVTRPTVSVEDESLGFLPGTLERKMQPWTRPIMDIFEEYYSARAIVKMMTDTAQIELSPLAYMRGRTFKNAVIIADEMQNSSPTQMRMLLTRMGESCKMVITGDLSQLDVPANRSGLLDIISRMQTTPQKSKLMKLVRFYKDDVLRSASVAEILSLYDHQTNTAPSLPHNTVVGFEPRIVVASSPSDAAMIPRSELDRTRKHK